MDSKGQQTQPQKKKMWSCLLLLATRSKGKALGLYCATRFAPLAFFTFGLLVVLCSVATEKKKAQKTM